MEYGRTYRLYFQKVYNKEKKEKDNVESEGVLREVCHCHPCRVLGF